MRHRGPAQRRQVHPVQRADEGRHRRRELPFCTIEAQRRRRRTARSPAGQRWRRSSSPSASCRRSSSSSTSPAWSPAPAPGRGPGQPVPRPHPRDRRDRQRGALLRRRERDPRRRQGRPDRRHRGHPDRAVPGRPGAVEKSLARYVKVAKAGNDKEAQRLVDVLDKCQAALNEARPVRGSTFSKEERAVLKPLCLITAKPAMFVGNVVDEHGFENNPPRPATRRPSVKARQWWRSAPRPRPSSPTWRRGPAALPARDGTGRARPEPLIRAAFKLLGLQTLLHGGVKEVRAWTIHVGDTGPQAAGVIHGDERGYIRARPSPTTTSSPAGARARTGIRAEAGTTSSDGDVLQPVQSLIVQSREPGDLSALRRQESANICWNLTPICGSTLK